MKDEEAIDLIEDSIPDEFLACAISNYPCFELVLLK